MTFFFVFLDGKPFSGSYRESFAWRIVDKLAEMGRKADVRTRAGNKWRLRKRQAVEQSQATIRHEARRR